MPQHLRNTDAVVVLHSLGENQSSLVMSGKRIPLMFQIVEPGASFITVNFKYFNLLPGDKVVVRDLDSVSSITITTANASALTENLAAYKSPQLLLLRTHPLLIEGDVVVVEYIPSIPSLILPFISSLRGQPVVILDSYAFVRYSLGSVRNVNKESTVGAIDEAREAVCFRKTNPMMYAKARAVARLVIRTKQDQVLNSSDQITNWVFCTGWLVGEGNHLLTNYHCMKDAVVVGRADKPAKYHMKEEAASTDSPVEAVNGPWQNVFSPVKQNNRVVETVVGFMAETRSCSDRGYMGENVGVVEATKVSIVAESARLDYALVRVLTNDSKLNLSERYGYLRLRASGPVDGEEIYIPQHPRGEPKEIAAVKDGKPATIETLPSSSFGSSVYLRPASGINEIQPIVWYSADTEPGSSGSPVLSRRDNTVVALHHAGSSEAGQSVSTELYNEGIRIELIACDLLRRRKLPRCAVTSL
ncbi:hypothetical protein PsorP6_013392 [Peronosclerospora sorghi]|uniref:Uncharacterized protein n=1 Tax=Peronosclerospora sorghi TaxID=230839 RepID=A0ACC0WEH4_9STRA|nr:hypothetical protein PsorP6_013392 [Peronosclerospora sorghi]